MSFVVCGKCATAVERHSPTRGRDGEPLKCQSELQTAGGRNGRIEPPERRSSACVNVAPAGGDGSRGVKLTRRLCLLVFHVKKPPEKQESASCPG